MKRGAVVIGVNKTGELPILQAAGSGARNFAAWARGQGIEVALLTDGKKRAVTVQMVKTAIRRYVDAGTYDQLIVFFSGHGLLRSQECELWLLTGAPADPTEAVNVAGSIWLARNLGIPHIVIISDACRSQPPSRRFSQVSGSDIFPNEEPRRPRPEVDVFYATLPGDPAHEAAAKDADKRYQAIFTQCLLQGLQGEVPDVIEPAATPPPPQWVIPSWTLKRYLENEVPRRAEQIQIQLKQDPDIRVESHPPKYLAQVERAAGPSAAGGPGGKTPPVEVFKSYRLPLFRKAMAVYREKELFQHEELNAALRNALGKASGIEPAIRNIMQAKGRQSFETRTGFTVIGAEVERVTITGTRSDLFRQDRLPHIRVHENDALFRGASAFIQLEGGITIVLAVLPGFIGTVIVDDDRVMTVNYTPSRNTNRYYEYQEQEEEIDRRRAFAAVAARNGLFRIEREEATRSARYLRLLKSLDPTLGLYAAYAYAQGGLHEEIESVYRYMCEERVPVLYDVALLADKIPVTKSVRREERALFAGYDTPLPDRMFDDMDCGHAVSPCCPMLTQGWALLGARRDQLQPAVREAGKHLVPCLWTTFDAEGADILWSALEKGEIA